MQCTHPSILTLEYEANSLLTQNTYIICNTLDSVTAAALELTEMKL